MNSKALKIGLTTVVLVLAFGGLLWSTLRDGTEYYKHVEEVMAQPDGWYGKRLQLHGYVVPASILRRKDSLDYRFQVHSKGHVVPATYTGIVPDTFKDEAEVVLKGTLTPGRVPCGAQRRHGEMPVEVRAQGRRRTAAPGRLIPAFGLWSSAFGLHRPA